MRAYSLAHLSDSTLLHDLTSLVAQDRTTTAALLAHIAEFDAWKLYLPAGYPSTFAYCVEELHLSEDATCKRTQAARAALRFPMLFEAMASGELNMTAVNLLAPHLTRENARELISAATRKRKGEIEEMLAARFPRPELPASVRAIQSAKLQLDSQPALAQVGPVKSLSQDDLELAMGR